MLTTRIVTDPVHTTQWCLQVLIYEDAWSTVRTGTLFACLREAAWLEGK
jgi:hypothetical protein